MKKLIAWLLNRHVPSQEEIDKLIEQVGSEYD